MRTLKRNLILNASGFAITIAICSSSKIDGG